MLKKNFQLSALALALSLALPSWANPSTDTVFVSSKLGQPLRATVLLPQEATGLKLAPAEAYQSKGLPLPQLTGLAFDFAKTDTGRPFLRVSTVAGYVSPAQTLLIEQTSGGQTSLLEYAIFVDPLEANGTLPSLPFSTPVTAAPVQKKPTAVTSKPVSKQSFNAAASSVNARLAALEKGQKELFKRFEETDRKLNLVLEKIQIQTEKPTPIAKNIEPAPSTATINPQPTQKVAPAPKPSASAAQAPIAKKSSDTSGSVSVTVPDGSSAKTAATEPVATPPVEKASAVVATAVPTPPVAEPKPKRPPVKISEPPPPEPTLFETVVNEPVYLAGGVLGLLALALGPLGLRRFRRKKEAASNAYTVQPGL